MKIGSHVIYVRMERGTDKQLNPVSYEATLLGQEVSPDGAEGAARLVFVHPDKLSHLNSSDWARAFEYAEQVPFEPQGEYFHGFSEPQRLSDDSINAVFGKLDAEKDAEMASLKEQLALVEAKYAASTEGTDEALQAMADASAKKLPSAADLDADAEEKKLVFETKQYSDGSSATGVAPLPDVSPEQQAAAKSSNVIPISDSPQV